ncbi:Holliday junction resolvase RuvX [Patescibacteria group bacterium]|nr:Holliday junction resolvase RuvX [Patescibacteria group bacterium]MBU4600623.1 Holliday junction resolvase RuvX [Patescibacteria group bacterium]MCG2698682.1 Holliday junction resolvase RuvX [Candidatus Parcubacteria bacterium]MCG2701340.1 Holliday junction resolvase RuvX [Candidatus Parcubacteria bacterium]
MRYAKKYLGIDWGEKRIGLALGDSETKIATPFKVAGSIKEIVKIIKEEKINAIIIGKPVKMSGRDELSDEFESFVKLLEKKAGIPIEMIDERLSSKAADALVGGKRANPPSLKFRRARAPRDAIAAMLILQSYFDGA